MACEGCEQRRQKLKAMYDSSAKSIANAIAHLSGRDRKTEQSAAQPDASTDQPEQRVATVSRSRAGRNK